MPISGHDQAKKGQEIGQDKESRSRLRKLAAKLLGKGVTANVLLESMAEGVVVVDETGTIIFVNARAEQMFGYAQQELVGKPHAILIPERFREAHRMDQAAFLKEPSIRVMGRLRDVSGLRSDGSEFPLEISLGLVDAGNGMLVLALVSDITVRKRAESELQQIEELFHIQMKCVQDYAIFMLDANGRVLSWNEGSERLHGYRAEEIVGRELSVFYDEEQRPSGTSARVLEKAQAQGQAEEIGWWMRKDRSRFWADEIVTALRDAIGNLRGFSIVVRDIGERKRAEDAQQASEARYRALYDDNPTMIITIDGAFDMISVNATCVRQLGFGAEELVGQQVLKLFHRDDVPAAAEQLRVCFRNPHRVFHSQFHMMDKDGGVIWADESARAVYDLNGVLHILVVCHDITESKRTEEALRQSERRFQAIFNLAAVGIAQISLSGNWMMINQRLCDILGYSFEELKVLTVAQISHPDDLEPHLARIRRLLAGDISTYHTEKRYFHKNGSIVWVNLSVTLVRGRSDKPEYFIAVVEDISDRMRAEELMRESEEKFAKVFQLAPIGISISSLADGVFVDLNEAGERLSGYRRDEVIGRSGSEFQIWKNPEERALVMGQLLAKGEVRDREMTMRDKAGRDFWGLYSAVVIEVRGEKYLLSLVSDIGERKRAREELQQANDLLQQRVAERTAELSRSVERLQAEIDERIRMGLALQEETAERLTAQAELREKELMLLQQSRLAAMGEMIGNIAHQWRQPLNLLGLLAQDLTMTYRKGGFDPGYLEEAVRKMLKTIRHMSQTIDDFRNFFQPFKEKVDFRVVEIVAKTISLLEGSLNQQMIKTTVVSEHDPVVNGYPNEFSQVLLNVMINARDAFLAKKVAKPSIAISIDQLERRCLVTITDNAGGIPEEIIDRIFDPYFTTKGPDKGTGLGLFMAKTIIEKNMGGTLSARNVGGGAEFRIEL